MDEDYRNERAALKRLLAAAGLRMNLTDRLYVLDDQGAPVKCDDMVAWSEWMASHDSDLRVAHDMDEGPGAPPVEVSTIFLGYDMDHLGLGEPVLFETMVFGGPLHHQGDRYRSREAALAGHQAMCQRVRAAAS